MPHKRDADRKEYMKKWRKTPRGRYYQQRSNAIGRGISWEFTFDSWWAMWGPHWDARGLGINALVMCRNGDIGPYSPDNCRIDTMRNNVHECSVKKNKVPGVIWGKQNGKWRVSVRIGGKSVQVGSFADWFDAVCARKSAENRYYAT